MATTSPARPECDGSKKNGTRNCDSVAVWKVKLREDEHREGGWWGACAQHLSQVGVTLLNGEQGELIMKRLATTE